MTQNKNEIQLIRKFIKDRLQKDHTTFRGYQNEWKNIYEVLKRTGIDGESNSLLLIGPRGSGKTTLITSILSELLLDENFSKNILLVQLNGLLHTDDRLALKSITIQLNLENSSDGKVFGSFAENLSFLLDCLKSSNRKKSKSILFLLDEFDLFCSHHNQTLLYNLFDVSQSEQAPICVLGLTCRLDIIELLEKRVKSRFSHRQIFLFSLSNNFDERLKLFLELLKIPPTKKQISSSSSPSKFVPEIENSELTLFKNLFVAEKYKFSKEFHEKWNKTIDLLIENPRVRQSLEQLYDFDISESFFKTFLYKIISQINDKHPFIKSEDIIKSTNSYEIDDKVQLLCGLSVLELCLIISMKHHSEIYDRDPFNFEICFIRFMKFAKTSSVMQGIERAIVLKAFEHLRNLEFISPISSTTTATATKTLKEFQMFRLLLTYGQINQAINKFQALPTEVAQWATSSLI